eukprot:CAMPEP_0184525162 /NCGR_PEP_ID=MMETSP0198_2-20121128/9944_1 /TAXON_ID=1112570 /ORGANISM="Thraustochytrium sp., Strain LLF1b" /LENGTH=40 /DNA_ID= /DNA_START= /DNA_END= /DNA_ORIENTATION=
MAWLVHSRCLGEGASAGREALDNGRARGALNRGPSWLAGW